jgi:hypothetical protein
MLPGINIEFQNGQLGQVVDLPDGVSGLLASATAVGTTFLLNTPYQIKSMIDVAALGIIPDVNNYRLYKALRDFYAEAGEGTELWLMGFVKTTKVSDWFTLDVVTGKAPVEKLLDAANGKLKFLWTAFSPSEAYVVILDDSIDSDVMVAVNLAQILAENYTTKKYAPFFTIIEGYAFDGNKVALGDLSTASFNRVMIVLGDTEKRTGVTASKGAAVGIIAGRLAKIQVHVNVGKVRDGALTNLTAFILDTPAESYDIEALHDKGYVTFRQHTGKSGYFFTDDPLACEIADDYHYAARRRVIDKAYRLAYTATLDFLLDDNDVLNDGTISPIYAATVENEVESLIYKQMTANGELSFDPNDSKDRGVICKVDLTHNVTSTSKLKISKLQVKTKGTNRWIDVPLGFVPVTSN